MTPENAPASVGRLIVFCQSKGEPVADFDSRDAAVFRRRWSVLVGALLATGPSGAAAQAVPEELRLQLEVAETVTEAEFIAILNDARVHHLVPATALGGGLALRLYAVPRAGDCVPASHVVCSHRYYVAVSEDGEAPAQAVFGLGEVGEIRRIEWVSGGHKGRALLHLEVSTYPASALEQNGSLEEISRMFQLEIGLDGIAIRQLDRSWRHDESRDRPPRSPVLHAAPSKVAPY